VKSEKPRGKEKEVKKVGVIFLLEGGSKAVKRWKNEK
jgi:hypothetical protein